MCTATLACGFDVWSRRIPNLLTFGSAALAVVSHVWVDGAAGGVVALTGWIAGIGLFLPLVLLGGMGAGDMKLLAAFGAWLGAGAALWTALFGSIAGAVYALVLALSHGVLGRVAANLASMLRAWHLQGVGPVPGVTLADASGPRVAFALPLTAGLLVTLWLAR